MPDTESRSFVYTTGTAYLGETGDGFIPNITGTFGQVPYLKGESWELGAFSSYESRTSELWKRENNSNYMYFIDFSASRCSSVYQSNKTYVRPKYIVVRPIIRY